MDTLDVAFDEATSYKCENHPSPENFDLFLPWACNQLAVNFEVIVINVLSKFAATKSKQSIGKNIGKGKNKKSKSDIFSDIDTFKSVSLDKKHGVQNNDIIKIYTVYDNIGNLIQLKFDRNIHVPRKILQIIGLVIHFHEFLSGITINRGLNKGLLHELKILISHANITDVCLDNTCIEDGYELLLEKESRVRYLSLSRCQIKDDTVEKIASKLMHPLPASRSLSLLNLASNSITDKGAKSLALALRTNRTVCYLNLSDNTITDEGAGAILDVLKEFPITHEELVDCRSRYFQYIREKKNLIDKMVQELKSNDLDKRSLKKKNIKTAAFTNLVDTNQPVKKDKEEMFDLDAFLLEKAEYMANNKLGEFKEPLSKNNIATKNDIIYCKGNNCLAYINLSYNDVGYLTVKKIVSVLKYQKMADRKPRGLVNIYIEGNCIPSSCSELKDIDTILSSKFVNVPRKTLASNILSQRGKTN